MLAVCTLMRGRDEINNALAAGASYLPRARPIFPSPFPFLAPATQAIEKDEILKWDTFQEDLSYDTDEMMPYTI